MKNYNSFFFKIEKLLLSLLLLFSILINQYYGNLGVSPLDSFSHFDTGYRVLHGQYPFKDFWVISGPILDYFQSFLFFIFGISWQSYVLQSSIINAILTLATYFVDFFLLPVSFHKFPLMFPRAPCWNPKRPSQCLRSGPQGRVSLAVPGSGPSVLVRRALAVLYHGTAPPF